MRDHMRPWTEIAPHISPKIVCRFWTRVDRGTANACWEWCGGIKGRGYGSLWIPGARQNVFAHRIAYALLKGAPPDGALVLHTCDNKPCCNPKHLFLGTHEDNMADMRAKGRAGQNTLSLPTVTASLDELHQKVGERSALVLCSLSGMHGYTKCTSIALARELGISRERVRQIKEDALRTLGLIKDTAPVHGLLGYGVQSEIALELGVSITSVSQVANGLYAHPNSRVAPRIRAAIAERIRTAA